jgi:hypothetical protein
MATLLPAVRYKARMPLQSKSKWSLSVCSTGGLVRFRTVIVIALLVHIALGWLVMATPEIFLHADRASTRWRAIQNVVSVTSFDELKASLAAQGNVGDYGFPALVYAAVGQMGLVVVQVLLSLASGFGVYRLGRLLRLPQSASSIAALVYLLLPHTLVLPHQLSTEAWSVPTFVLGLWLLAEGLAAPRNQGLLFALSALLAGVSALVRPVAMLWGLTVALVFLARRCPGNALQYLCVSMFPLLAWMMVNWQLTGESGLGESGHSLSRNLYLRVEWMADSMRAPLREEIRRKYLRYDEANTGVGSSASVFADPTAENPRRLQPLDYARFALAYPGPFLRQSFKDISVFVGKSGIERLTIDVLEPERINRAQLQTPDEGWRRRLEKGGAWATVKYLWATVGPVVLLTSVVGSGLMVALTALAIFGAVQLLRSMNKRSGDGAAAILPLLVVLVPVYFVLFSQVTPGVQSRHRAPAEFALVLLAGYAIQWLLDRRKSSSEDP